MGEDILTSAGMAMTEEQQSMPLRDAVFMSLRKAILTGKLKPGDRLTEVKLGKLLGTSRTPIREAIRLLELDGLVTYGDQKRSGAAQRGACKREDHRGGKGSAPGSLYVL